jgi:hypothetical protein
MKFAQYVIGGYAVAGAVFLVYWLRLGARVRRAERLDRDA